MVILLAQKHCIHLDSWQKCGCPDCLAKMGYYYTHVWHEASHKEVAVLAPLPELSLGRTVSVGCLVPQNSKSESQNLRKA